MKIGKAEVGQEGRHQHLLKDKAGKELKHLAALQESSSTAWLSCHSRTLKGDIWKHLGVQGGGAMQEEARLPWRDVGGWSCEWFVGRNSFSLHFYATGALAFVWHLEAPFQYK